MDLEAERRLDLLRPHLDLDLFLPLDAERRLDLLRPHLDLDLFLPLDAERPLDLLRPHFDLDLLEERRLDRLLDFPHFLLLDRLRDFFFPPHFDLERDLLPAIRKSGINGYQCDGVTREGTIFNDIYFCLVKKSFFT